MKGKKLFAMLLALVMACSVFAGCSGGGGSNSGSGSSAAEESAAAEESGESGEDSQAEAGSTGEITWEDPYEVVMCYIYFGTLSEDLQMVEDAMNEIALEKTNTQVSLLPLSFSEISTQPQPDDFLRGKAGPAAKPRSVRPDELLQQQYASGAG